MFNFDETLDDENVVFWADPDVSYYGNITDPRKDDYTRFVIRRLSLTAHLIHDPGLSIACFDHVLQACSVGTVSSTSREFPFQDLGSGTTRMLFGGRKRPQVVDIQWLQKWIDICENEHNLACSLTESQERNSK